MENEVLKLEHPFDFNNEPLTHLSFKRIKVGDLRNLPKDELESILTLLSRITGQPMSVISKIDLVDFTVLGEILKKLQEPSPQIGKIVADG